MALRRRRSRRPRRRPGRRRGDRRAGDQRHQARSTGALLGVAVAVAVAAAVVATARPPSDLRAVARDVEAIERRFDAVVRGAGLRPDGPRLARTIDADVIAPLRAAAARIRVDPRMPPRDRARAAALTGYAAARLRALELFVRYLDTGDASLQADIRAASAEADAALAAAR
ncbi:MAG: hypothetical protein H6708_31855 [Kofleriaceae bacterium]|nr:hypothetical protein [Kofleriaceae bacterium]